MSGRDARRSKTEKGAWTLMFLAKRPWRQSQRARDRRFGRCVRKSLRAVPPGTWDQYSRNAARAYLRDMRGDL